MPTEADTCRTYVLPKLQQAGWADAQIGEQRTYFKLDDEFTDGRIQSHSEHKIWPPDVTRSSHHPLCLILRVLHPHVQHNCPELSRDQLLRLLQRGIQQLLAEHFAMVYKVIMPVSMAPRRVA